MLDTIFDLGVLYLSDFGKPTDPDPPRAPLDLCACVECQLVQLRYTTAPDLMFRKYWYLSSINETMRDELADIVQKAQELVPLEAGDVVMDIGANDGTLLAAYPGNLPLLKVAYEPAENLQDRLKAHAGIVVPDYFPRPVHDPAADLIERRVKILTSIAMFYDLDDPKLFIREVGRMLHQDGVWIVQFQDLHQMLKATAFDNICHEHLIYYSLETFEDMIAYEGLKVVKVELRPINGGSYRIYVRHNHHPADESVNAARHLEAGCQDWDQLQKFAWRARMIQSQIRGVLHHLRANGKTVDVYGASTKFNTIAQCCGIGPDVVRQAWERSPAKFGLHTVTGIPIVNEIEGRLDPPDALLVGIWQFRESILRRESRYLSNNRAMIFPLPHVEIVRDDDPD